MEPSAAGHPWTTSGKFDGAVELDGIDGIVTIPHSSSLNLDTVITVEAWIYADTLSNWNGIIRKGLYDTGVTKSWGLDIQNVGGVKKARFFIYDGGTPYIATSGAVSTSAWHHLAGTYDGSTVNIYLDGDNTLSTSASYTGDIDTNTENIIIGKGTSNGGSFFDGLIDEVRIWNVALDSTQIGQSASLGEVEITKKLTEVAWDNIVIEDDDGIPGVPIVPMETEVTFTMDITVTNNSLVALSNVVVKDNLGGDLELISTDDGDFDFDGWADYSLSANKKNNAKTEDNVTVWWSGKTKKTHLSWNVVGPLTAEGGSATLTLVVQTDINPGGGPKNHQEYTSEGPNELNSGATLSFCVEIAEEDICLALAGTDPIGVTASEAVLLLENKDSNWSIISDDTWGVLGYNLAGPTFDFEFYGNGLAAGEDYSLIYYPDPGPVTVIASGTSDVDGDINLAGSYDFGMDLTDAKIWLVLTDDIVSGELSGWNPTEYLFEHHLITYTDTSP